MKLHQKTSIESYNKSALAFSEKIGSLENYNHCYDYLASLLSDGNEILDLACGPANISSYLCEKKSLEITGYDLAEEMLKIARNKIPDGTFAKQSIIDFPIENQFDLVINGFGIPYLNLRQIELSFENTKKVMRDQAFFYLSFMEGNSEGFERTSFCTEEQFYVYYHDPQQIRNLLSRTGFSFQKEWILPYTESDGSLTNDHVWILKKQ